MKKIVIAIVMVATSMTAFAQRHGGYRGDNWVAPLVVGTIVGGVIASQVQPREVIIQQQPVYVQPRIQPAIPAVPEYVPVYKTVEIYIPECNCRRTYNVQIN